MRSNIWIGSISAAFSCLVWVRGGAQAPFPNSAGNRAYAMYRDDEINLSNLENYTIGHSSDMEHIWFHEDE